MIIKLEMLGPRPVFFRVVLKGGDNKVRDVGPPGPFSSGSLEGG